MELRPVPQQVGHAMSLVYDLRLNKPLPSDVHMTEASGLGFDCYRDAGEATDRRLLERQHAVLGCFLLSSMYVSFPYYRFSISNHVLPASRVTLSRSTLCGGPLGWRSVSVPLVPTVNSRPMRHLHTKPAYSCSRREQSRSENNKK
jgi:hypothetical protein